ncbi:MAG: aminotransferase class I/II-fold pyridoxal phosphate-dependent enzyme [Bacteroidota bacterium]
MGRTQAYADYRAARIAHKQWPFEKMMGSVPAPTGTARTYSNGDVSGLNFSSQNYLGLTTHPRVLEAVHAAIDEYGTKSWGSAVLVGRTEQSTELERQLAGLVGLPHAILYPTGWAAGFGVVQGLVRKRDHVVMDRLAHACLQVGAQYATPNVHLFPHIDNEAVRNILEDIRAKDTQNAILVVTEGLFSMDSDVPNLRELQAICRAYDATLLVDVAHDLGSMGQGPHGQLGEQGMLGEIDLVMGSFSKTFGTNGGFVASSHESVCTYLRTYSSPAAFTSALSPGQIAVLQEAVQIIASPEGERLRAQLLRNSLTLRDELRTRGLTCMGVPSAIVPVVIGSEPISRRVSVRLEERGVLVNLAEFPAVPIGHSRLRMQLTSQHEPEQLKEAAKIVAETVEEVTKTTTSWL